MIKPNQQTLADLSDQTSPKEALRRKEAFNFALFQYNPAPTVVVDRDGRVVKSNLARRFSLEGLPVLGTRLFDPSVGTVEAELHRTLLHCIASAKVAHIPERPLGRRIFAITMAPVPDGAIVITQDITEQKTAQEQLIQADKMVALGTLVSGVAHEISNPNNVLLLGSSALKKICNDMIDVLDEYRGLNGDFEVGPLSYEQAREQVKDLAETICRASERIRGTVTDLKEFARKDATELCYEVNINAVAEAAARLLAPIIRKSTNRFELHCAPGLPLLHSNAQRIEQVIVNLLSNACQALSDPEKAVRLITRHDPETDTVVLEVRDEGPGIPPENLKRLTDPFFTTKQDRGGTGLGLSISRKIVEQYGGTLSFESDVGSGTTARVVFPCLSRNTREET